MTTKVIIECPMNNHKRVKVTKVAKWQPVHEAVYIGNPILLSQGHSTTEYVHSTQTLVIEEVD